VSWLEGSSLAAGRVPSRRFEDADMAGAVFAAATSSKLGVPANAYAHWTTPVSGQLPALAW
jgi:hypothetical protein